MSLVLDDLSRDPDQLLRQLQQTVEVIARQNASLASLQAERDTVLAERDLIREKHDAAQAEIEKLRLLIRQLQRGRFGRRSERLDPDQLQLGLEDLEQTVAATEASQEAASRSSDTPRPLRPRRRNLGALPAHLPRVEVLVDLEDKSCPCCGGALHPIGEDTSEMLDLVPAQLRVKVIRRPRYACRACEEAVVQAPAPERPITGGMATEALLAQVLVAKYADFLPLYRQAQIFARQGIGLDRSTLCDWVGRACWWLEPLWRLLRRHVMGSTRIFADDTTLPVLDPGRGRTKTGRLWGYAVDDRPWGGSTPPAVVYLYAKDRRGEHPAEHLAEFRGILQADGYGGFKGLLGNRPPGTIRLAFCWAHCRRRFYEIHQATGSPLAEETLRRIGELYAIEAEIRGRPAEERRTLRQERSKPIVDALHSWLTAQLGRVSGRSTLAEAIRTPCATGKGWCCSSRTAGSSWTRTSSSERSGRSPWGARTHFSRVRTAGLGTGRSWRAWWRPRGSTGSSPWPGSPTCSSGWSRAGQRPTSSNGCCPGPGRRSGLQLPSVPERRAGQMTLAPEGQAQVRRLGRRLHGRADRRLISCVGPAHRVDHRHSQHRTVLLNHIAFLEGLALNEL
jgi:transposase